MAPGVTIEAPPRLPAFLLEGLRLSQTGILRHEASRIALSVFPSSDPPERASDLSLILCGDNDDLTTLSRALSNHPFGLAEIGKELLSAQIGPVNHALKAADKILHFGPCPLIMGIVNVTPDSFSDGGCHFDTDSAVAHAMTLVEDGADILDVGGQSTRPGALQVSPHDEAARIVPVVAELSKRTDIPISIDTWSSFVAERALNEGACIINDVSAATFDERIAGLVAAHRAAIILMHMQGTPQTMQVAPSYENLFEEVMMFLGQRVRACEEIGIAPDSIVVDPGIGFGKTLEHNLELLRCISAFRAIGKPVLVGHSRKSFIGAMTGRPVHDRELETLTASLALALENSVDIIRVHDVRSHRRALDFMGKLRGWKAS
ncbi:MAG: hypothetical protein Kow00107_06110 [Planctomycetota bacterium]